MGFLSWLVVIPLEGGGASGSWEWPVRPRGVRGLSGCPTPRHELEYDDDECDDQKEVDEAARRETREETKGPENEENEGNGKKHDQVPVSR